MSEYLKRHPISSEAYENYIKTGNRRFSCIPKNPDYLLNILNSVPDLLEDGYIANASDNLTHRNSTNLVSTDSMSFDITAAGIEYVRINGQS